MTGQSQASNYAKKMAMAGGFGPMPLFPKGMVFTTPK